MHSIKNILERNKIDTQSRADAFIKRKRLISKSDNNLRSGCTEKYFLKLEKPLTHSLLGRYIKKQKTFKKPQKTHWAGF